MKKNFPIKKIKKRGNAHTKKSKKNRKFKGAETFNSGNAVRKNTYQMKLNKIEKIYENYTSQYSKLEEERRKLFNNLVKKMEQKKIEILRKEIS